MIMISLLPLVEASKLPNFTALPCPEDSPTELETIEVVEGTPRVKGNTLVRVGVSATNERLRRWCIKGKKYTIPLNTIMVEMTIGGTNGPICHGAGRAHPTLSDLVRKVEYVDCHGNLQVIDNPEHLRAAAGCFGLIGVITHLTLEFSPMTYALMQPKKIPVVRAIPPPPTMREEDIPPALRVKGLTPEDRAHDLEEFEKQCSSFYYAEWFWFPYSDSVWVNCWNDTTEPTGVSDYPSDAMIFFQFITQFTMNILQNAEILKELINITQLDEAAVTLLSGVAMLALPDKPVKTHLTDALHFQRGIQNVRVMDLEVEIPIPGKPENKDVPDYRVVQTAWWDAILTCYKHNDSCPQRMPLEMRIMGGSDIIMAPQRGNHLGTCAIEVLTLHGQNDIWVPYAQEILDKWLSYTDVQGNKMKIRPHWAKQWDQFVVDGNPWKYKIKADAREDVKEFKSVLQAIGKQHGWTLSDLKKRFSNDFFDFFYFDDVDIVQTSRGHGKSVTTTDISTTNGFLTDGEVSQDEVLHDHAVNGMKDYHVSTQLSMMDRIHKGYMSCIGCFRR
jgi:hypothetical protein